MKRFKQFLRESKKEEQNFKKYILDVLFGGDNSKVKLGNKKPYHIRTPIKGGLEGVKEFWKSHGIIAKPADINLSGSFNTYVLTAKKKLSDDVSRGSVIHYVNNDRASATGGELILNNKSLTPELLGLGGETLTSTGIIDKIKDFSESLGEGDKLGEYCVKLCELAAKTKGKSIDISKIDIGLKSGDLKVISKDLGEAISGCWATNNLGFSKIEYPSAINEPLIDFYGVKGKVKSSFSVKSGSGSGSSIKNVVAAIEEQADDPTFRKQLKRKDLKLLDLIIALRNESSKQGILTANITMKTPAIKTLAKIMNDSGMNVRESSITEDSVDLWLQTFSTLEEKRKAVQPLYDTMGRTVTDRIWKRLGRERTQNAAVINPMGYYVVDFLNKEGEDFLNNIIQKLTVIQLDVNVKTNKMTFSTSSFADINFHFEHHASIQGASINAKLGFKKKR